MEAQAPFWNRLLLDAGLVAGGLFVAVTLVEIFARPGFNIRTHAISMLSLGERGWLMQGLFILSGLLTLAAAVGLFNVAAGGIGHAIGPLLVAAYGLGLILAGFYSAPAGLGFPPGTPDDMQPVMDREATIHSIAFMLAFGSLILACFVFAVSLYLGGSTGAAMLSLLAGVSLPALIALGVTSRLPPGIAFYIAAVLAWVWLAGILLRAKTGS